MKLTILICGVSILIGSIFFGATETNDLPNIDAATSMIIATESKEFSNYWNDGKAEISSYELQQSRYGELHEGEATLIFVTEPFSKSKQVKLDDYRNEKDRVDVLKLNAVRKFQTGIYPYSMMTSVFSPYKKSGLALKITSSIQEWCGHTFKQFNRQGKKINISGHSYFESEGETTTTIADVWLEDELWNLIRIDPTALPKGEISIIPGLTTTRFQNESNLLKKANAQLQKVQSTYGSDEELNEYSIQYIGSNSKTLKIHFETTFPYTILGWEEIGRLTTTARLKNSIRLDYWTKNSNADRKLLKLLE